MKKKSKIYITQSSDVGVRCKLWAVSNCPDDCIIVDSHEEADQLFSVFHNKIFKKEELEGKTRCFNFHGGLLPAYRGSCTLNWVIINGEAETGVTLHIMDSGIDTGPIVDISKFSIEQSETAESLYKKLEAAAYDLFVTWFRLLINGKYHATAQLKTGRLYKRSDIDAAKNLTRYVRAFEFAGKENAYYFTRSGKKIYLSFED